MPTMVMVLDKIRDAVNVHSLTNLLHLSTTDTQTCTICKVLNVQ